MRRTDPDTPRAPVLIALPQGLSVSGVTTWAIRLAGGLAERGHDVAIIAHPAPAGHAALDVALDPRVRLVGPAEVPSLENRPGDVEACVPVYGRVLRDLMSRAEERGWRGPAIVIPNLHGDCFGIAAALSREPSLNIRVLGWQHSDIAYDTHVLTHYESILSRIVGVSEAITGRLREALPAREAEVARVAYGVECPPARQEPRPSFDEVPLRLLYSGRLEHHQKRVLALATMARELHERRVAFQLDIVGDGPARDELHAALVRVPAVRLHGPASPAGVMDLLRQADALVLPSRYEGLSVAMLEAMAAGVVPIVAWTRSGAGEAIEDGVNGLVVPCSPGSDEQEVGVALADAVERVVNEGAQAHATRARAARQRVVDRYSLARHVDSVASLIEQSASEPRRCWPIDRSPVFSARGGGSVPVDGAARVAELLRTLAGRRIVVHGTGQHTRELADVIAPRCDDIVAFADDDRARQGSELMGKPVIAPADAARLGGTDVVLSTWIHEADLWARREVYERQGLRVHRIYGRAG